MKSEDSDLNEISVQDLEHMDFSAMDQDTQIDCALTLLEHCITQWESRGIAAEVMDAALFSVFVSRLSERGARDEFDDFVQQAEQDPWPSITHH